MNDEEIAKWLGISQGYFSKGLKWARNNYRNIPNNNTPEQHLSSSKQLDIRLHRLQRTYKLLNAISEEKLRALKLNDKLNGVKQYLGMGFRVIAGNDGWWLELEGIELYASRNAPVAITQGVALTLADNIAKSLANQYSFVIAQEGHTPLKLTEFEFVGHPSSEKLEKKGIIKLYEDKEGYSIWTDKSFGLGGLESNKVEYEQRLIDFANDMGKDNAWQLMKETMQLVVQQQKLQNEFFINHNELIATINRKLLASEKGILKRIWLWLFG